MRIRALILGLALAAPALGQELAAAPRGELGVRWWVSSGETKISHNAQVIDPALGNPTSVLVYENLDANALELFGRLNFARDWFLKGSIGVGRINAGAFQDEDFLAGQVKISDTTSAVPDQRIGYGTLDIGYQWVLAGGATTLGVFAGFSQWTETYDAYGATDNLGFIGGNIGRDVLVISNKVRWRALRLGVAGGLALGRARLTFDLAAVPYAEMRNEDSHVLRAQPVGSNPFALGPVPNIIDEGDGWGVQLDAALRYELRPRTHLEIGARFWSMEVRDGTSNFRNIPGGEVPLVDFYTRRAGVTLSVIRTW